MQPDLSDKLTEEMLKQRSQNTAALVHVPWGKDLGGLRVAPWGWRG